ncbi:MAG: hypothetical protein RLZZ282_1690 [Verrucomicrobiota bacterium]|jgi:hypothetical protein
MNSLIKIGLGLFALFVVFSMISQCGRNNSSTNALTAEKQADIILKEYSKGLDLDAVTALAKKSKDGADFERLLNNQADAVNNIDLNDDEKVDYIKVTEYGGGERRGFSLTTEISPGKTQEIATIDFQKDADKTVMQTTGNPSLYGPGNYHHSSFSMTDALLMGWLFSNRPSYASPYGFGNYPPSYGGGWNRQETNRYSGTMRSRNAGSSVRQSSSPVIAQPAISPNAEKLAAKAKALTNPTQSQRSFARSSSRPPPSTPTSRPSSSGGFGRSTSSSSSRSGGSSRGGK